MGWRRHREQQLGKEVGRGGRRRRIGIGVLAGALLALGLASCSSDPQASGTGSTGHSPIKIGFDATESGPLAPYFVGGVQWPMAEIKYANAHGGIDGHPIQVTVLDDGGNPGTALVNTETLWTRDHVVAMIGNATASSYIQQQHIPFFTGAGNPNIYGKFYTSIFSVGGQGPAWSAQTAYWIVKIEHRDIKTVGVMYAQASAAFNPFIVQYWKALGATTVDLEPDGGPSADCTALILKFKSEGVQYFDEQGQETPDCILAEQRLGWSPPDGQGGPVTSEIGEAELIGKPFVGVVAGAPNTLSTGAPIHSTPTAADKAYVAMIEKYYPSLANYGNLNGTGIILSWGATVLLVQALRGTMHQYGQITSSLLIKYTQGIKNFNDGLNPPIKSFEPDCKTGSDGTIWGFWHYNPNPTALRPSLYMVPTSGAHWVTNAGWLESDPCYLSHLADQLYPNG